MSYARLPLSIQCAVTVPCSFCTVPTTIRNVTRIESQDVCPGCCAILGRDSIADVPEALLFCRWDSYPWRPQDYR